MTRGTDLKLEMDYICPHCGGEITIQGLRPYGLPFKIIDFLKSQPEAVKLKDIAAHFSEYHYSHVQSTVKVLYKSYQISKPYFGYYTTGKSE